MNSYKKSVKYNKKREKNVSYVYSVDLDVKILFFFSLNILKCLLTGCRVVYFVNCADIKSIKSRALIRPLLICSHKDAHMFMFLAKLSGMKTVHHERDRAAVRGQTPEEYIFKKYMSKLQRYL